MAKVFLINAPYSLKERYGRLAAVGSTLPHYGLTVLGAVLRQKKHQVHILDASASGLSISHTMAKVDLYKPDIIGLTAVTPSIFRTNLLAEHIKKKYPKMPIILGGPHVSAIPEETLRAFPAIAIGIVGEGENSLSTLIDVLEKGQPLNMLYKENIPGVAQVVDGRFYLSAPENSSLDLDDLPFPAWDLLEGFPEKYHPALFKFKTLPSTHIISSRGCPHSCIFCDSSVFGQRVRFHSPEYIIEMIAYLKKTFQIKEIIFEDDQFLLNQKRVAQICEGILEKDLKLSWSCSGRVNSVKDPSLLKLMRRSGCWQISFGIESSDDTILKNIKKGITNNEIEKALHLTHKAGIEAKGFFIFGFPYETERTIKNTMRFALKMPLSDISVFMLTPFPGSEIYKTAHLFGAFDNQFDKMNILEAVFVPNTISLEKLKHYQKKFAVSFYTRPKIIANYMSRLVKYPSNALLIAKAFRTLLL